MNTLNSTWIRFFSAAALLIGAGVFLRSRSHAETVLPRQALASFPLQLGEWGGGKDLGIDADVRQVLGEGDFLQRIYQRTPSQPPVDLFVAYFPTQRTGSTIHSPQNCLPGAGWTPIASSRIQLARPGLGTASVNHYLIAKGMNRQLVLYWYQSHGRVVASEYWAKFYMVADSMRMNRSDGALVRILTPVSSEESAASAERRAADFAQLLMPKLSTYLPD